MFFRRHSHLQRDRLQSHSFAFIRPVFCRQRCFGTRHLPERMCVQKLSEWESKRGSVAWKVAVGACGESEILRRKRGLGHQGL